jgi:hypothetical protein
MRRSLELIFVAFWAVIAMCAVAASSRELRLKSYAQADSDEFQPTGTGRHRPTVNCYCGSDSPLRKTNTGGTNRTVNTYNQISDRRHLSLA